MEFVTELKKLGFKDKEAAVYLACLELGSAPVQQIGRKAKVVRATTYVILEQLMKMGLVTRFDQGKKTLFSPEPPHQLLRLLEKEQEQIQEKQEDLKDILPELQMLMKTAESAKPTVRFFEGKEGLHAIRQEINMYAQPGDMIYHFTPADHLTAVFPDEEDVSYPQRVARGIRARTIFTTKSEKVKKRWLSDMAKLSERRFVPYDRFPSPAGITIYRDRIAMGTFSGRLVGVVIESAVLAGMMRHLFELSWQGALLADKKSS